MYYTKLENNEFYLRLEKGEEIVKTLMSFCAEHNLQAGHIQGIGGLVSASIGVYRLAGSKEYEWKEFSGDLELTSLMGNIAMSDEGRMLHLHVNIGNEALEIVGGHLKNAIVGGTVELYIKGFDGVFMRKYNDDIGLKLLDFNGVS